MSFPNWTSRVSGRSDGFEHKRLILSLYTKICGRKHFLKEKKEAKKPSNIDVILDPLSTPNVKERIRIALDWCQEEISWYERTRNKNRFFFRLTQGAAIFLSALTPILIIIEAIPVWAEIIPPILVTMIIGFSDITKPREDYIRFAVAMQKLKFEKKLFELRTSENYSSDDTLEVILANFTKQIKMICLEVTIDWASTMKEIESIAERTKQIQNDFSIQFAEEEIDSSDEN